jgi:hypothetical protein
MKTKSIIVDDEKKSRETPRCRPILFFGIRWLFEIVG